MQHSFVMKGGDPTVRCDPVGHCIYCGSPTYAPERKRALGEEHIIPESLGGTLVLPLASCGKCERTINRFEQPILKTTFHVPRVRLGIRRKKRKRSTELYELHGQLPNGQSVVAKVPIKLAPAILFVPRFHPAKFLDPDAPDTIDAWAMTLSGKWLDHQKFGLHSSRSPLLNVLAFCQFLAKIAHSYAYSLLGEELTPFLVPFMMDGKNEERHQYVGGVIEKEPPTDNLHELALDFTEVGQRKIAVVRIRLLASLGTPVYFVVAGEVKTT